jgi:multidrug efflux pump
MAVEGSPVPLAFFIRRPVATTLLTLGIALLGVVAFFQLPVSPLPQVEFPVVMVSASLPGASPETMAASVATPLERTLGTIAGVNDISSSSTQGSTSITLQFDLSRSVDDAAIDVEAAINAVRPQLPSGMTGNPSVRKGNSNGAPIMVLSLTSKVMNRAQMYDAAATVLGQKLSQVEGVGQVSFGGGSLPAVRVELNPHALAQAGISAETVRTAIAATNANRPKGQLEEGDRHWQINANDQALKAADYRPLVVAWKDGAALRLADVAEVVDGAQDLRNAGLADGKPAILLTITQRPDANIVDTIERVKALLPQLRVSIPSAITLEVAQERSATIRASLRDVGRSLAISVVLVVLVVMLFLPDRRAALIPAVAVPVSLIGTLAFMYLAGFSLNNLSLMALTVATGFVVDDAVVVLENIARHVERGLSPMQAALRGVREVGSTVVSMTLSLIAVFIPILFMGGIVGRLFREFAVTLSVAVLLSLVVSLSTTPMMCARLLHARREDLAEGRLARLTSGANAALLAGYRRSLAWALAHAPLMLITLGAVIALNVYLFVIVPKGFFPQQDTGRLRGYIQADQSISFQSMEDKLGALVDIVRHDPAVASVVGFTGGRQRNTGMVFVSLKPVGERKVTADEVINRLRRPLSRVSGAALYLQPVQDIRAGGHVGNSQYQYTLLADRLDDLRRWEPSVRKALGQLPQLADVNTDLQDKGLQTNLQVDRAAAARLGLSQRDIDNALNDYFGQRLVSTIYNPLNQYRVVMEAAPQYWQSPEVLKDIVLIAGDGQKVPLAAVASWAPGFAPLAVNHQGQFAASTVSFALAPGVSLGQAHTVISEAVDRLGMPNNVFGNFTGNAQLFESSMSSQPLLLLGAIIAVYLVLGILYENLVHPVTILSTLPSAGVGALFALLAFHTEFTVIALIGVILLIGIVKKNAIMMVDFALAAERERGLSSRDAIFEACLLRFRPIMMTTMAALFGAIPLAIGGGDGAELRQPLGIAVVGGLILSQLLTLYTTPVVYLYLDRLRLRWHARRRTPPVPAASS